MQAVIFIGIQAAGKSTFYQQRFFHTHVRISLDLMRTRHRESQFLKTCLQTSARFVLDNTNPLPQERKKYIDLAKEKRYEVVAYYFHTSLPDALLRNRQREGKERIKDVGLYDCQKKLTPPSFTEGFDQIFMVRLAGTTFEVEEWDRPEPPDPSQKPYV
ncbi:ATP-binding protein [Rufibacter ruber]|uniref:ATP-binding protein n=1 Tax=Rufibacter ruber TaxID=1783499 RepID=UPI0008337A68|nr:ATP-binding protein [Rufibacter ruber]